MADAGYWVVTASADHAAIGRHGLIWAETVPAAICPLLDRLDLTRGLSSWGMAFRYGLRSLSATDFALISAALQDTGG